MKMEKDMWTSDRKAALKTLLGGLQDREAPVPRMKGEPFLI